MGHAIGERISLARGARLEHGPRDVPLKEMHAKPTRTRHVRELMDEETLAGAGKSGEEHHPSTGERSDARLEPRIGTQDEARITGIGHRAEETATA